MKRILTLVALGATMLIVGAAQARTSSGAVVALKKTALGTILVDAKGRTLYLFEKDHKGVSMCNSACTAYWPPLTSQGAPRAGSGIQKALLTLGRAHNGVRQVLYAGHPLYTFVGDKSAGQATGEGLTNFGAGWYVVAANGRKIEHDNNTTTSSSGGYGW